MNSSPHRALLVEIVNADQHPGRVAVLYPFLKGFFEREGVPTRWVRFGFKTTNLLVHGRDQATFSPDDLEVLLQAAREYAPTLILVTDPLSDEQVLRLRAAAPQATLHVVSRDAPAFAGLPAFRGVYELDDPSFTPGYDWEPGNAAALPKAIDNVFLLATQSCGYSARVADNELYAPLDDDRVRERRGCAFCSNWIDKGNPPEKAPAAVLVRQIRAAARRTRPDGHPGGFLLPRLERASVLKACVEALRDEGLLDGTQLLVAVRADRVDQLASFARSWFRRDPASPFRLGVYACGIESFVDDELARFNKGLTAAQGVHALQTLRALAAELPGRFWYSGLTFILFTPWTTLEMLHQNVAQFVALGFVEAQNVFQSRLRLHPRLAITALAERDGLLVDAETDPVLVMNRRKLFEGELAWRFADARVHPVCQLALRFDLGDDVAADELTMQVRRALRDPRVASCQGDRLQLFLDLVETAATRAAPFEAGELFEAALERYLGRRGATPSPSVSVAVERALLPPSRTARLAGLLIAAVQQNPERFPGLALQPLPPGFDGTARLRAHLDTRTCDLELAALRPGQACLFQTRLCAVSHAVDTPLTEPGDKRRLERLFEAVEGALARRSRPNQA